jgi:hypothetical protein
MASVPASVPGDAERRVLLKLPAEEEAKELPLKNANWHASAGRVFDSGLTRETNRGPGC